MSTLSLSVLLCGCPSLPVFSPPTTVLQKFDFSLKLDRKKTNGNFRIFLSCRWTTKQRVTFVASRGKVFGFFFSFTVWCVCVFIDCVCVRRHAPSETRNYSKATEERLAAQNGRCVRQPGASIALRQQQREAQNGKFY